MTEGDRPSLPPNELPPELAAFLRTQDYACLTQGTDQGTVFVLKAPRREIESLRGTVPIQLRHELHQHPSAPVIRMVVTIYDQPASPLAFDTFINVDDPAQGMDFLNLAALDELRFLFYDESLSHRLTKTVANRRPEDIVRIVSEALTLRFSIPEEQFNFDRAKAAVMERNPL